MQPQAAAWSLVSLPERSRLPPSLYLGWLLLWGHLGSDENDFDPFFTPKMRKMEHGSRSRRSPGNGITSGCLEPPALNRSFEIASGPILWLAGAPETEPPAAAWSLLSLN